MLWINPLVPGGTSNRGPRRGCEYVDEPSVGTRAVHSRNLIAVSRPVVWMPVDKNVRNPGSAQGIALVFIVSCR